MRTVATCFLLFAWLPGCTHNSGRDVFQMVPSNADDTWTSDALQRGDTEAIRNKVRENSSYIHQRDFVVSFVAASVAATTAASSGPKTEVPP